MSPQDFRPNEQTESVQQFQREEDSSKSTPQGAQAIDPNILQDFRDTMGDNAEVFLAELIDAYLEDSPSFLQEMRDAIALGNMAAMEVAAHTLKSSSVSLGAIALCELCQQLETVAKSPSPYTIDPSAIVSQIESEYARVKLALQAELQGK